MRILFQVTIFTIFIIKTCKNLPTTPIFNRLSEKRSDIFNRTEFNITTHLQYDHIRRICMSRDPICKSNDTKLCAVRKINDIYDLKDFDNSCYLFLSNMCDYPGNEYYITETSSCSAVGRRHYEESGVGDSIINSTPLVENDMTNVTWDNIDGNTTAPGLREAAFSTLYDIARAADGHPCASTCPNVYHPVCMNVNRNYGKYLKFFHFVNHCEGDRFYCLHWKELEAPPGMSWPAIAMSYLDWSYCGAQRYLNFMYVSQSASSMGHYGWLEGDERYSKILEPDQRRPGFG